LAADGERTAGRLDAFAHSDDAVVTAFGPGAVVLHFELNLTGTEEESNGESSGVAVGDGFAEGLAADEEEGAIGGQVEGNGLAGGFSFGGDHVFRSEALGQADELGNGGVVAGDVAEITDGLPGFVDGGLEFDSSLVAGRVSIGGGSLGSRYRAFRGRAVVNLFPVVEVTACFGSSL